MRPSRTGFARLLAGLLLLQWALALLPHARAMARTALAQGVEICTHDGRRVVPLDLGGQPAAPDPDTDCCTLCQGPAGLTPEAPSRVLRPAAAFVLAAPPRPAALPPFPPRAPPQQPRAPPTA